MTDAELTARCVLVDAMAGLIASRLDWPLTKANAWMKTNNPHLGEVKPATLILEGRSHKVMAFIESALAGEFS